MERADMQMTLDSFLEPSSTVALLTVLSPIERDECSDTSEIYQTQLKATQTSLECTEHDSGCAKENVTRLNQSPYNTVAPRCGMC